MHLSLRRKLAIGATAVAAAALAGGAYAATQNPGPTSRQAFLNDVAKRLNVSPAQLKAALNAALLDRLNAAVKAGDLTQAQADAIKRRLERGGAGPLWFGPPGFRGPRFFGGPAALGPRSAMTAAARYLGLSDHQLFDQLRSGKTLAQIAQARGKSVSGLEQVIVAAVRAKLDQAVANKRITKAQEQQILSNLSARIHDKIYRSGPRFGPGRYFRHLGHPGGASLPAPPAGLPALPNGAPVPPTA
jgi:AraC-like DNA-binding protein